jgi:hypothetical protein
VVALVGNIAIRSSCGFANKKFMGKETEVILSARARLSARNRGVFRQVLAKTCGNSGRSHIRAVPGVLCQKIPRPIHGRQTDAYL